MPTHSTIIINDRASSSVTLRNLRSSVVTINASQRGLPGADGAVLQQEAIDEIKSDVTALQDRQPLLFRDLPALP